MPRANPQRYPARHPFAPLGPRCRRWRVPGQAWQLSRRLAPKSRAALSQSGGAALSCYPWWAVAMPDRHELQVHVEHGAIVGGRQRLLSQALANLLDNALRHTPAGTSICIICERDEETAKILVRDDGPGAATADFANLFRRFVRGEHARGSPGNGLGLAMLAAICSATGGTARIEAGAGFAIRMTFPLLKAEFGGARSMFENQRSSSEQHYDSPT